MNCDHRTDIAVKFSVDAAAVAMENRQFWRAIGYDGLFKLVHEPAGQFLLDRGAAKRTIKYLRTHCTFSNSDPADAKFGGNVCGRTGPSGWRPPAVAPRWRSKFRATEWRCWSCR